MPQFLVYDIDTKLHFLVPAANKKEARLKAISIIGCFGSFKISKPNTFKKLRYWEKIIQSEQNNHV